MDPTGATVTELLLLSLSEDPTGPQKV
ncbi:hypothetical protein AVEN_128376-1, partial [Araneus ventricosus]